MKSYQHLNLEERERLYALRGQGKSFREIARVLGRSHATLSREYARHAKYGRRYLPCKAHEKARKTAVKQRTKAPLKNPKIFVYVREKLREEKWSPENIAGRLPIDHPGEKICHETIYRYVYCAKKARNMKLWRYLKLHRKRRLKKDGRKVKAVKVKIPEAVRIDKRPKEANSRKKVGHWETDNLGGKTSDQRAVSGLVERKTRYVNLDLLKDRSAETKAKSVTQKLKPFPKKIRKTLTADNGAENTNHQEITRATKIKVYFCFPYHSWEKGSVENAFGRVRRYLPKGTSLDTVTQGQIKMIENKLNHTPMKCLNYLTPYEKMNEELSKLKTSSGALQL